MPFENPIIAGEELIRPGIRSEDYKEGETGWRVGRDGSAEFSDLVTRGSTTGDAAQFESLTIGGNDLEEALATIPEGLQGRFDFGSPTENWGGAGPYLVLSLPTVLKPGHTYMWMFSGIGYGSSVSGDQLAVRLRYEWDGPIPTNASPIMRGGRVNVNGTSAGEIQFPTFSPGGENLSADDRLITVGIFVQRISGTGNVLVYSGETARAYCIDLGISPGSQGTRYSPVVGGGNTDPVKYTKQWGYSDVESYQSNGAVSIATNHSTYGYQGNGSAVGNPGGDHHSIWRFNDADIRANLAGATILESYVYVDNVHCYLNSGVTARIGTHNLTSMPSTFSGSLNRWSIPGVPKGGDKWSANLGTTLGNEFKAGTTRGIVLGGVNSINDYSYYNRVFVKFVYEK